jgi:hypothetical protein
VAGKMWGAFSTLWLDKCRRHLKICGGKNVGHIFNSVVGPWMIEGHERGIDLSFRLDIFNSVTG